VSKKEKEMDYMDSNVNVLKSIFNNNGSVVNQIYDFYNSYRLSAKEKAACELFFFDPNLKNAIRALESTPKAWVFIKKFVHNQKAGERALITYISILIEAGELNGRYLRKLVVHNYLNDFLKKLLAIGVSSKLEKYVKQYEMEIKLKR
jgi:hypothetical protein